MRGTVRIGNKTVISYRVIKAASQGEMWAINLIKEYYRSYINHLSTKEMTDEHGKPYYVIDRDLREVLEARLMDVIFNFDADQVKNRPKKTF